MSSVYDFSTADAPNAFANYEVFVTAYHDFREDWVEGKTRRVEFAADLIGAITCADITP